MSFPLGVSSCEDRFFENRFFVKKTNKILTVSMLNEIKTVYSHMKKCKTKGRLNSP